MKSIMTILLVLCAVMMVFSASAETLEGKATTITFDANEQPGLSRERLDSLSTIQKISDYEELNIYSIDIQYDYDLDRLTPAKEYDMQVLMGFVMQEALPGFELQIRLPDFGCSSFTLPTAEGGFLMGRNYDFRFDTSALIVRCHPKDGYASVAHCVLDNLAVNDPLQSEESKMVCLASPFMCLDGMNEKGVGISVLTLDCEPTVQKTGKPVLSTGLLIRAVLDKAASTAEAIELISGYDCFASAGRDYHFLITDASGDSRIIEFDPLSEDRKLVATPSRSVTNFFVMYSDKVEPNQNNGIYGHGKERYNAMEEVFNAHNGVGDTTVAWEALRAASQVPNPNEITSNTQWSVVYDLNNLCYEFVLHRNWDDIFSFSLQ